MESCSVVEKEVDKVLKKFKETKKQSDAYATESLDQFNTIQRELRDCKIPLLIDH